MNDDVFTKEMRVMTMTMIAVDNDKDEVNDTYVAKMKILLAVVPHLPFSLFV